MANEEKQSLESRETENLKVSDQVLSKEDSLREKLAKLVQNDDSELPQSIKDEFQEK